MAGSGSEQARSLTQSSALFEQPLEPGRPPTQVAPGLWLFAPNRHTQGGSSWLLAADQVLGRPDVLIDAPALTQANLAFLQQRLDRVGVDGGLIVLTSRQGHGQVAKLQQSCPWPVLLQEQEAYLLPGLTRLSRFAMDAEPAAGVRLLWTPGPTPGACVLHVKGDGLDVLFCGRLLVPVAPGALAPLRTVRTFHWGRQLASLERLKHWMPPGSPSWIATGAALGALRGQSLVENADSVLRSLDLTGI